MDNFNNKHTRNCFLKTSGQFPRLLVRSRTEKQNGLCFDTNLVICTNCPNRRRPVALKSVTNSHYECVNACCPLAYHWNMCEECISSAFYPVTVEDPARCAVAEKFQRVFSKLPDELQRLIGEYVPEAFAFVKMSGNIIRARPFRNGLSQFCNLPREIWASVHVALTNAGLERDFRKLDVHTVVKTVCARIHNEHYSYIIQDSDFWHKMHNWGIILFTNYSIVFTKIMRILYPDTIQPYLTYVN